jgi:hypothetical protein
MLYNPCVRGSHLGISVITVAPSKLLLAILSRISFCLQIQRMVISGGNFKPDTLKPKEVVSLLLDDEEIEKKCKYDSLHSDNLI